MAFTKVVGPGIHTLSNIASHNINSSGIITATKFVGPFDNINVGGATTLTVDGINISAGILTAQTLDLNGNGDISGNLVIGGNLTANGDFTTLNTTLRQVELLRVDAQDDNVAAGIITQRGSGDIFSAYDTSTEVFKITDGGDVGIARSIFHLGDTNCFIGFPDAGDQIVFEGGGHERFRINGTTGRYLFGRDITGRAANYNNTSVVPIIQLEDDTEASISVAKFSNSTDSSRIYLQKGRGSTSSAAAVQDDDTLGMIVFNGYNGSGFRNAAQILAEVDGIPTSSGDNTDMPGALVFKTSPDGTNIPQERLRITSAGEVVIASDGILTIKPNPAATYGVQEALRIDNGGTYGDRALQIFEYQHSGMRYHRFQFNTHTTTNGSAYTHTQGAYGGSSAIEFEANGELRFFTNASAGGGSTSTITPSERFRIDSSGRSLFGTSSSRETRSGGSGYHGQLQMESDVEAALTMTRFGDTHPSRLNLQHARGTIASIAAAQENDDLGQISFSGWDSDTFTNAAEIRAEVDGAPGDDDMPGRLIFSTTPDNASGVQERLRIDKNGNIKVNNGNASSNATLILSKADAGFAKLEFDVGTSQKAYVELDASEDLVHYGAAGVGQVFYTNTSEALRIASDGKSTFAKEILTPQDYPDLRPTLDFNFAAVKKLDPRIKYYRTGPASYVNEFGKIVLVGENTPRFDYGYKYESSNGYSLARDKSQGLLLEMTRENLVKQSIYKPEGIVGPTHTTGTVNDWSLLYTSGGTGSLTPGFDAPDGSKDAVRWTNGNTGYALLRLSIDAFTPNGSDTYVISFYVKGISGTGNLNCDLHDGGPTAEWSGHMVTNEWRRIIVTGVPSNASKTFLDIVSNVDNNRVFDIWGVQLEKGTYATSFIPTLGEKATRGYEHLVIDGEDFTDFYNPLESSVLAVGTMQRPAAAQGQLNIFHIGDDNEDGHGVFREHGTKDVWYHIRNGNSTPSGGNLNPNGFGDWDADEEARIAVAFKDGDQAISVNGGNQITATVTSSYPTSDITKMWIGSHGNGSYFEGHIKRIAYYPKKLTDSQLNNISAS